LGCHFFVNKLDVVVVAVARNVTNHKPDIKSKGYGLNGIHQLDIQ
jgi:hypothetical protein